MTREGGFACGLTGGSLTVRYVRVSGWVDLRRGSGMADELVRGELVLLKKARHMDLMNTEALADLHLARKASQGIAVLA
ncbi:hypothetical protein NDU88_004594 [Pleurodeles waltl]|uniref:Uncharacterized protein n=1 Tax=Pleurodeles waltl TaxID=8319 RepID=A0AAV7KYU9_PLEWA|nr:hypothetical protein NDU88_004594 [Pleurodeles waltl]